MGVFAFFGIIILGDCGISTQLPFLSYCHHTKMYLQYTASLLNLISKTQRLLTTVSSSHASQFLCIKDVFREYVLYPHYLLMKQHLAPIPLLKTRKIYRSRLHLLHLSGSPISESLYQDSYCIA